MSRKSDDEYEVGYGKPPQRTQFKKGQSGNPKGRPKGSKSLAESVNRELDAKVTVREGNREIQMSKRDALAKRMVAMGLAGDKVVMKNLLQVDDKLGAAVQAKAAEARQAELSSEDAQSDAKLIEWLTAQVRDGLFGAGTGEEA